MARPLRLEFPGATYHLTSRGDRREEIFRDDDDARIFLSVVADAVERFKVQLLVYCLMGNHYHLVVCTPQGGLSHFMRHINGVYTQAFNRRHSLVGHLFQGRFKAILVDTDNYLLQLCRYVELNPVRAGLTRRPQDWAWSSFRAHIGLDKAPDWLDMLTVYGFLLGRPAVTAADFGRASEAYAKLVADGAPSEDFWGDALRQQIYLGDQSFIDRVQMKIEPGASRLNPEIPKPQRSRPTSLAQWLACTDTRAQAMCNAYLQSGMTMTDIARESGLSVGRVSQLIKAARQMEQGAKD